MKEILQKHVKHTVKGIFGAKDPFALAVLPVTVTGLPEGRTAHILSHLPRKITAWHWLTVLDQNLAADLLNSSFHFPLWWFCTEFHSTWDGNSAIDLRCRFNTHVKTTPDFPLRHAQPSSVPSSHPHPLLPRSHFHNTCTVSEAGRSTSQFF